MCACGVPEVRFESGELIRLGRGDGIRLNDQTPHRFRNIARGFTETLALSPL